MVHVLWSSVAFWARGRIPKPHLCKFSAVLPCRIVRILLAIVHCFLVSQCKPGCGLVGSSTRSLSVGMFSFHSCFHFSWRLKSFARVKEKHCLNFSLVIVGASFIIYFNEVSISMKFT